MYTVTLAKFKGGVGATEAVVNLAQLYAFAGWRVLVVDTDPQGGASERLLGHNDYFLTLADAVSATIADRRNPKVALDDVIHAERVKEDARRKESFKIGVVPANRALQDEEGNIGKMPVGRTKLLKRMLSTVADQYDLCLIDTPPVFGYLSRNAIVAADGLLLPLLPEPASFKALGKLRSELDMMSEEDEVPPMVGTILSRFSVKSDRHRVGEKLLEIASGYGAHGLSLFDSEAVKEFDMNSIDGLRIPYLGNVANDNEKGNARKLRKAYNPIAKALSIAIGFGYLSINTEAHNATVPA